MKKHLLSSFVLSLVYICASAQTPGDYSFRQSYRVSTPADIHIKTNDGYINSYSSNNDEILVYFIVQRNNKVLDMNLEELRDLIDVDISHSGNSLEIVISQGKADWSKDWRDRYNVSFHILAPKRTDCDLKTSDGNIELVDFVGNHTLRTSDGNITAEGISGKLIGRTSDGDINAQNIHGNVELQTSDGDIVTEAIEGDCNFRTSDGKVISRNTTGSISAITSDGNIILEKVKGDLHARTSDGNINFEEISGGLAAQTSDGDIRGDFIKLTDRLSLKTSDGNISVTVPEGLGMNVLLKGEDIHTRLEDFSGTTDDHRIEGRIRGGGIEVELVSSDGDVSLNYN